MRGYFYPCGGVLEQPWIVQFSEPGVLQALAQWKQTGYPFQTCQNHERLTPRWVSPDALFSPGAVQTEHISGPPRFACLSILRVPAAIRPTGADIWHWECGACDVQLDCLLQN